MNVFELLYTVVQMQSLAKYLDKLGFHRNDYGFTTIALTLRTYTNQYIGIIDVYSTHYFSWLFTVLVNTEN